MNSFTEENYLKAIFKLMEKDGNNAVSTNSIAEKVNTKAATVTDMLKKLSAKKLINYQKYQGVTLTQAGKQTALSIIRKHRLWEVFLVEKLKFKWDQVHDMAEQLEHINSDDLVNRLDIFLGRPKTDPHGDPIPDTKGVIHANKSMLLSSCNLNKKLVMTGVVDHSPTFLQYLDKMNISLGDEISIHNIIDFDRSFDICINRKTNVHISNDVAKNILVSKT
jgi:DtxR family Mn-dependent transcriptional regulator